MNDKKINIDRLINSVGTETFITYFDEFAKLSRHELVVLFSENNKSWKDNSKVQKANNGKRIFENNLELEALEHIITKKKENNISNGAWVKKRANEIYNASGLNSKIESEVIKLSATEKEVLIKYRLQQGKFRKELLNYWKGCSITECKNSALLIASHIKPYSESNDDEKYDTTNGLLLTPTFDKLFDRYLITIDKNGKLIKSQTISLEDQNVLGLDKNIFIKKEKLSIKHKYYLQHHNEKFNMLEKSRVSY